MLLVSPLKFKRRGSKQGFTLIELLTVIAIITILAGLTFSISRSVRNAQSRATAKAELATLAQAIEQFKSRYGDYPWHQSGGSWGTGGVDNTNQMLLYALTGRLVLEQVNDPSSGTTVVQAVKVSDDMDDPQVQKNPKFIDPGKFLVELDETTQQPIALIDPWGNPYKYWYKWDDAPDQWVVFGYHLYSLGPDGVEDITQIDQSTNRGAISPNYRDSEENIDNIFAGE